MNFVVFKDVYEPAEDSYLLAKFIEGVRGRVLDIGTGCGIQALTASKTAESVVGIDINPTAVENAKFNARLMKVANCEFFAGDLFEKVEGKFDCVIFNAPYLPTNKEEKTSGMLDKAWNGGKDGRFVIDRFLERVGDHVKKNGKILLLQNDLADVSKSVERLRNVGCKVEILGREKFSFEELVVIEAKKLVG